MTSRNLGLDIVRSVAITMVIAAHVLYFFTRGLEAAVPAMYVLGMGVELFFALSGFLIGGILIRDVVENPAGVAPGKRLFLFYVRRWMRTLPLYFALIAGILLFGHTLLPGHRAVPPFDTLNLVFLQNFSVTALQFQPVSWSLAIEEWFYLLIPLGMLLISMFKRNRASLIYLYCGLIIGASLIARIWIFKTNLPYRGMWDFGSRKQIFVHMDSLMFGVLFAALKAYHGRVHQALCRNIGFVVLSIGILGFSYHEIYSLVATQAIDGSWFAHGVLFTLIGLGSAMLVASADLLLPARRGKILTACFHHISVHSYAYYLLHWYVFMALAGFISPNHPVENLLLIGFAVFLLVSLAYFTYDTLEHPLLRLRDRVFPTPRAQTAIPAEARPAA
jgi:peptidoglycan/LPS O-acetylase OafA/YrhL